MSLDKTLESITERDLQALVDDQKAERKTLEYKQTLPGGSDDNRKEFLADVSSFANASGGHLLFGFEEQAGVPQKLVGAQVDDIDGLKLRLENMLRDGLSPRLLILPRLCGGGKSSDILFHKEKKNHGQEPKDLHRRV